MAKVRGAKLTVWCCMFLALVTGCGGSAATSTGNAKAPPHGVSAEQVSPSQPPGFAPSAGKSAPSAGGLESAPLPATAPPMPPSADEAPSASRSRNHAPEPTERPGLGTEWGETRESRVHDVTFTRADESRPFALASLFYNDRRGVEAMASAHARNDNGRSRELSAAGGAITVAIHDGSGESLDAIRVGDRTYVVGQSGERYTIVLTNHTNHRFEAVGTVDGLDVINGKTGTLQSRGYVLMPFATLEIDGFRQSNDAVAAFRFAAVSDSYAAQTGTARNVGVIGVAFFSERGDSFDPWSEREVQKRETANPFPGSDPRFARPPR